MPSAGFELAILAFERPQTCALGRTASRIGLPDSYWVVICTALVAMMILSHLLTF